MSRAAWLAAGAAGAGVAGAWEALAAVERTRVAAAVARVLEPLARAGREGRTPTAPERRRLWAVAAAVLLVAGWLAGGVALGVLAALAGPAAVLAVTRARRRRWREELRRAAPACARTMADALGAGRSIRTAIADAAASAEGAAAHELGTAARALALGEPTEAVLVRLRTRAGSHAWDTLTAAVLLQRDAGGDLAGAAARAGGVRRGRRPRRARRARRHRAGSLHRLAGARAAARRRGARRARGAGLRRLAGREPALRLVRDPGRAAPARRAGLHRPARPGRDAMSRALILAALAGVLAAGGIVELAAGRRPGGAARSGSRRVARALARRLGAARGAGPGGLAARVDAAGVAAGVGEVMAAKLGAAPVAALAALALLPLAPGRLGLALLAGAPLAGFLAPDLWLRARARARARAIEAEQADVLDLLRVAVGAGLGPWRALAEVGRRHPGVLAGELGAAARRVALGVPADAALARLERRCPAAGTHALTAALRRADRLGAPPGRALAALAAGGPRPRGPPRRGARRARGAEDPARRRAAARAVGAAARRGRARARAHRRVAVTRRPPRDRYFSVTATRDCDLVAVDLPARRDDAERLEVRRAPCRTRRRSRPSRRRARSRPRSRAGTTARCRRRACPRPRRSCRCRRASCRARAPRSAACSP